MTDRHSTWSITINNPTPQDDECINLARQKGWKITGQQEVGENGTLHYQLMAETGQQRFSALKKAFPRAHIEPARRPQALKQYVTKEDTRVGQLSESQEHYPSLTKTWDLIYNLYNTHNKEGWNLCYEDECIFYRDRDQEELDADPMKWFDCAVAQLISKGYHVESLASNPQTRTAWKKFYKSILLRSHLKQMNIDRTTNEHHQEIHKKDNEEGSTVQETSTPDEEIHSDA